MRQVLTEEIRPKIEPEAPEDVHREEILAEMDRVLSHSLFKKSARCTLLLRHLIDLALEDPQANPKERLLGYEVFGRQPSYDTAADPIVRTTINEIRKRIVIYHHETGDHGPVSIDLPQGSYMPRFIFRDERIQQRPVETFQHTAAVLTPQEIPTAVVAVPESKVVAPSNRKRWLVAAGCVVAVALLVTAYLLRPVPPTNFEAFWKPFLTSQGRPLICVPALKFHAAEPADVPQGQAHLAPLPTLPWPDTVALLGLRAYLDRSKVQATMRFSDALSLTELKNGPAIFLGGIDNPWTLDYLAHWRFHIEFNPTTGKARIVDSKKPDDHSMEIDETTPFVDQRVDYAIVSRVLDANTGNYVLQLSGAGPHGTASATEFVMNPKYLNALDPKVLSCGTSMQFLLRTENRNGSASIPRVISSACW